MFFAPLFLYVLALFRPSPAPRLPNVIVIMADDLGSAELGCYGQQRIKTPHLDQMAREGMQFTQYYAPSPVCAPSRCMLLTGRHSGHAYIRGNYELGSFADSLEGGQMPLAEGAFTLGHLFRRAGYRTGCVGKWGLGMHNTTGDPLRHGFDYFYGYLDQKQAHNHYPTHLWENGRPDPLPNEPLLVHRPLPAGTTDPAQFAAYRGREYAGDRIGVKADAFMRQHKGQPFLLYYCPVQPHLSLQAPEAYVKPYVGQFSDEPYRGEKGYASTLYPRATYAGMITYLDGQVGKLMNLLRTLNLDQNTIVLFTSDNGATFDAGGADTDFFRSNGSLRGKKGQVYEGGIRVPMLVRWPGRIAPGTVTDYPAVHYDLLPTLAGVLGQPAPATDGLSFWPVLQGQSNRQARHPFLYWEFPEQGGQLAVRQGNWKGVKQGLLANPKAPWELYDLATDPAEQRDVARQHPDVLAQLDGLVTREHQPAHIREWEIIQPKFERAKK